MDEKTKKTVIAIVVCTATAVVSAVVTFTLIQRLPPRIIGMYMGAAAAGLLCGLVPYFIARKKNNKKLGIIALWSCIAAGLLLGILLAVPVAVILSIVIAAKPAKSVTSEAKPTEPNTTHIT